MKVIQCFLTGAKHTKNNLPCEDRTFFRYENGVYAIALADGAGNAKYTHSANGAECVCDTMTKFFCNNFDRFYTDTDEENLKAVITTVCLKALEKKAEELKVDDAVKLSSTMLVTAVKDNKVIACHVGDGIIGSYGKSGLKVVSHPDNGEFASSTFFITSPAASERLDLKRFELSDEISFFMMSDGLSDYVYDDMTKSLRDITVKLSELAKQRDGEQTLKKIITDLVIDQHPNSDDCSFIVLRLAPEEVDMAPLHNLKGSGYEEPEAALEITAAMNDVDSLPNAEASDKISAPEKKKSKLPIILPIAVAVVLIVAAVLVFAVFKPGKNKKEDTDKATPHSDITTVSEEPTAEKITADSVIGNELTDAVKTTTTTATTETTSTTTATTEPASYHGFSKKSGDEKKVGNHFGDRFQEIIPNSKNP